MAITFQNKITFDDVDIDGDVEVEIDNQNGANIYFFLSQYEIKELIEHLQKQLKHL